MTNHETYEILALRYGERPERTRQENFLEPVDAHDSPMPIDYFVWVLRNANRTVVVDTDAKFAYYVLPGGRAMRYGVGVGREGFGWSGRADVRAKKVWPTWTPPREMIQRKPELSEYAGGMPGGIMNPLGARAMYLYQGNRDTLYRLHGSPEYWTIGTNESSGCIRFMNQDIIDLYQRVSIGAPVVVRAGAYV